MKKLKYFEEIQISWKCVLQVSFFFAEIDTCELYYITSKYVVSLDKTKNKFHSTDNREVSWTGYETAIW